MIDKSELKKTIAEFLEGTDYFPVDVTITPGNDITVEIDSREGGVDIDFCVALTHRIEQDFDRDAEDYSLEVGSAGLTAPFKVREQWIKNIGNQVEVLAADGKKYRGELTNVGDDDFTIVAEEKVKLEGEKRPSIQEVEHIFKFNETKYTKYLLEF